MSKNRWTPEVVDRLRVLVEEGNSGQQIGMELEMTRNQIIGKVFRLGLSLKGTSGVQPRSRKPYQAPTPGKSNRSLNQQQLHAIRHREREFRNMTRDAKDFSGTVREVSTIQTGECKYPFNDAGDPNFRFCRKPTEGLASYCREHHLLCHSHTSGYRPGKERRYP